MPSGNAKKKRGRGFAKAGWKDIRSKDQKDRKIKLALAVLGLLFILIILSQVVRFTQTLFSPWKLSINGSDFAKIDKNYIWNGEFNINLLVRSKSISLLSISPKEEKAILINIPDEVYLEVPHGFGRWQLRSIYQLGQSENGIGGDKLLKDALTEVLGLPIDGFLDFRAPFDQQDPSQIAAILRKNLFSGFNLLYYLKTDLTLLELIRLKISLSQVRFDKFQQLDFGKANVLDKISLLDGTQVFNYDPVKLDSVLSDLADPMITLEHKSIAIYNATDVGQLAQKAARMVANLGGNVIITTNAHRKLKNTQVFGEKSKTLERLSQIFGLGCSNDPKCDKISPDDEDLTSSRAQINLFLGEDFLKR